MPRGCTSTSNLVQHPPARSRDATRPCIHFHSGLGQLDAELCAFIPTRMLIRMPRGCPSNSKRALIQTYPTDQLEVEREADMPRGWPLISLCSGRCFFQITSVKPKCHVAVHSVFPANHQREIEMCIHFVARLSSHIESNDLLEAATPHGCA